MYNNTRLIRLDNKKINIYLRISCMQFPVIDIYIEIYIYTQTCRISKLMIEQKIIKKKEIKELR